MMNRFRIHESSAHNSHGDIHLELSEGQRSINVESELITDIIQPIDERGSATTLVIDDGLCSNDNFNLSYIRKTSNQYMEMTLRELQQLRIQHALSSYFRNKEDIAKALERHVCNSKCKILGKRPRENAEQWPVILDQDAKNDIINEFVTRTSSHNLQFRECSFCGILFHAKAGKFKILDVNKTDISLLNTQKNFLRDKYECNEIEVCKEFGNKYIACKTCSSCVQNNSFHKIPLYSYANGCWIGNVPPELQGLTFLEELCIARVRSTRCTIKLTPGNHSQLASHGNVCIFPQEPKRLISVMPPPLDTLYDEVAIVIVRSTETKVTTNMLHASPLLVRREKILCALQWLKRHNWLYRDIVISYDNLKDYPTDGVMINYPVQHVMGNGSEGSSYTATTEANPVPANMTQEHGNPAEILEPVLQTCAVLDTDQQDRSQTMRKLEMIKALLEQRQAFVKFPRLSDEPVRTYNNPSVYGLLWPTLFPYGIGIFDDEVRTLKERKMRKLDMRRHVNHLLNLKDSRFQKHRTFPFVMMNILQRKISCFEFSNKMLVQRAWFPNVVQAMEKIENTDLDAVQEKIIAKKPLDGDEVEKSVAKIFDYVHFVSEDISGSIGETKRMKSEIRTIMKAIGLPQLFVTINPADTFNPIMQVFAGRDIDLNKIFDGRSEDKEEYERMCASTENPAAAARAFDTVIRAFIDIVLGDQRKDRTGLFGPLESYYGVVEAQGRGSLHCHFLVWLRGGIDPFELRDRIRIDQVWKKHVFEWMESVIKQDLPENTVCPETRKQKKEALMSRPQAPDKFQTRRDFENYFKQDIRNITEAAGQIHEHTATCFKHLTSLPTKRGTEDSDCRFGLPRETADTTSIDDDGRIQLKCSDGNVNGYNDVIVYLLRCNMDIKFVGSGTAAFAMTEYMSNYITKTTLNSESLSSTLAASVRSVKKLRQEQKIKDTAQERTRLLMQKICNSLVGKRELSGQQVTSHLQNIPNRYTNHHFQTFWWSPMLRFVCPDKFGKCDSEEEYVVVDKASMTRGKQASSDIPYLAMDYLYRLKELANLCLWDFWCDFKNEKKKISEEDEADDEEEPNTRTYRYHPSHPKREHQVVRARNKSILPILIGFQIPRSDRQEEERDKFHVMVLTLFKPWGTMHELLKQPGDTWKTAYDILLPTLTEEHQCRIRNLQVLFKCRDAADDFSRKRMKTTMKPQVPIDTDTVEEHVHARIRHDDAWMEALNEELEDDETEEYLEQTAQDPKSKAVMNATNAGFYSVTERVYVKEGSVRLGTTDDERDAQQRYKAALSRQSQPETVHLIRKEDWDKRFRSVGGVPTQEVIESSTNNEGRVDSFSSALLSHRQLCIEVIDKYTLNEEQAHVFLLFADRYGPGLYHCENDEQYKSPIRIIISGPGGTGKSQVFEAMRCFLHVIGHDHKVKFTTPTGLAANNIGGTTVHSETNLMISPQTMQPSELKGTSRRQALELRYRETTTQVIDEIYFLGARDNAVLSEYLQMAGPVATDEPYGNLNMVFAGDPAQLPSPQKWPLFDHRLVNSDNGTLNATNDKTEQALRGVVIWHGVTDCVVLSRIMRQKDVKFQQMLNRLRYGSCTDDDHEELQHYVVCNRDKKDNRALLNISLWVTDPDNASPLITYTNAVRDAHNTQCAKAFAECTTQEYVEYHSVDTVDRGKTILTGPVADIAWATPVKEAHDLAGKLPLVPGMPVFITQNIATHLGLANGSSGRIVSIVYWEQEGFRYAIAAEVDVDRYNGGLEGYPHRAIIIPVKANFKFKIPGVKGDISGNRVQLPLIPAFSYTAHNSQSRSLNAACIDLASCPNIACAYVMLSRLRSLKGLSILTPFLLKKIRNHGSEEVRNEIQRLDELYRQTLDRSRTELDWYYEFREAQMKENKTKSV